MRRTKGSAPGRNAAQAGSCAPCVLSQAGFVLGSIRMFGVAVVWAEAAMDTMRANETTVSIRAARLLNDFVMLLNLMGPVCTDSGVLERGDVIVLAKLFGRPHFCRFSAAYTEAN